MLAPPHRLIGQVLVLLSCALAGVCSAHAQEAVAPPKAKPAAARQVKVGVYLIYIGKLELGTGSYNAEFYVSLKWPQEDGECKVDLDYLNGRGVSSEVVSEEAGERVLKVKGEFTDDIDLSDFPFDQHALSVEFQDKQATADRLVFEVSKEDTGVDDSVKLAGWDILGSDETVRTEKYEAVNESYSTGVFSLNIRRFPLASTMKFLLPVFFIVFVSSLGLLLRAGSVGNRISLGTATLLASVMFHLSATSSIPPVGYATLADKFMLGTYVILLANLLSTVLILKFSDRKDEPKVEMAYNWALVLVPLLTVVVYVIVLRRMV